MHSPPPTLFPHTRISMYMGSLFSQVCINLYERFSHPPVIPTHVHTHTKSPPPVPESPESQTLHYNHTTTHFPFLSPTIVSHILPISSHHYHSSPCPAHTHTYLNSLSSPRFSSSLPVHSTGPCTNPHPQKVFPGSLATTTATLFPLLLSFSPSPSSLLLYLHSLPPSLPPPPLLHPVDHSRTNHLGQCRLVLSSFSFLPSSARL